MKSTINWHKLNKKWDMFRAWKRPLNTGRRPGKRFPAPSTAEGRERNKQLYHVLSARDYAKAKAFFAAPIEKPEGRP